MSNNCKYVSGAHGLCTSLDNITVLANSSMEPEEIMRRIVAQTAESVGCESARIAIRESGKWKIRYTYRLLEEVNELTLSDEELPHAALAMITKMPIAINDALTDYRINTEIMKIHGIRSVLALPLLEGNAVTGVLLLNFHTEHSHFEEHVIEFAQKVATAVAAAWRNTRLYQEVKKEKEISTQSKTYSDALNIIETVIHSTLAIDRVMNIVLQTATDAIGAETAIIFSKDGNELTVRYVYKLSRSLIGQRFMTQEIRPTAFTAETNAPMAVINVRQDDGNDCDFSTRLQVRALLDLPMIIKGKVIGNLIFHYHSNVTEFKQHQFKFVRNLQNSISLALENARLNQALQQSESGFREAES